MICKQCDKDFKPKNVCKKNDFCSLSCYWKSMRKTIVSICETCGTEKKSWRKYKYCSIECRDKDIKYRQKINKKIKGRIAWNKGKSNTWSNGEKSNFWKGGLNNFYCIDCNKKLKHYGSKRCMKCHSKTIDYKKIGLKGLLKQQNMKESTSIEKAVYDYLVLKGILFEKQKLINGKFLVDAYIPSLNLVIEADGKYWHSLPHAIRNDKRKTAYLKACGYEIIHLKEEEIKNNKFTQILKERLVM